MKSLKLDETKIVGHINFYIFPYTIDSNLTFYCNFYHVALTYTPWLRDIIQYVGVGEGFPTILLVQMWKYSIIPPSLLPVPIAEKSLAVVVLWQPEQSLEGCSQPLLQWKILMFQKLSQHLQSPRCLGFGVFFPLLEFPFFSKPVMPFNPSQSSPHQCLGFSGMKAVY